MSIQFEGDIFFFFFFLNPCVVARKLVGTCEASFQFEGDVSFLYFFYIPMW